MSKPCINCIHYHREYWKYPCIECHAGNHYMYLQDNTKSVDELLEIIKKKNAALAEAQKRISDIEIQVIKLAGRIGGDGYRQECVMNFDPFEDLHICRSYVPNHIILKMGDAIKDVDIHDLIRNSVKRINLFARRTSANDFRSDIYK